MTPAWRSPERTDPGTETALVPYHVPHFFWQGLGKSSAISCSIGLFGAVELVRNRATREPMAPFNASSPEMDTLRKFLLDRGLFVYTHWNIVLILPPLIISEDQLREGFAILDEGLRQLDSIAR